jgi:Na+/glutamate symporter
MTTFTSDLSFLVTFNQFITQARVTIAVPCWSSWKTGISSSAFNLSSISKHRGAEMSSRFIQPKVGAIAFITDIISSVS